MVVVFGTFLVLGDGDDSGSEEPADNGEETADASEAIYKENCSSFHDDDLSGENSPDLTSIGSDLSQDEIEEG